ncbi:MAG: hypothetical protein QXF04_04405 [Candidatus Aenigmatarchaeota archaeon]
MDRRILLLSVGLVAMLAVVNATVFTYRWLTGTVLVYGPEAAAVHGCVGFYSTVAHPGLAGYLPSAGTNLNAPILGTGATVTVTPGDIVCRVPSTGMNYLYESISALFNVTVGSWYIQDFYGFGYYAESTTARNPVYVYLRVESTNMSSVATNATLIVYNYTATGWVFVASLDLRNLGAMTPAISLPVNSSLRLDLYIDASATGTGAFKVGFYVTPESGEPPTGVLLP